MRKVDLVVVGIGANNGRAAYGGRAAICMGVDGKKIKNKKLGSVGVSFRNHGFEGYI